MRKRLTFVKKNTTITEKNQKEVRPMWEGKEYEENGLFQNLDFTGETLTGVEFVDCSFENCTFEDCTVRSCRFTDCGFVDCRFSDVRFEHTTMGDSVFTHCKLHGISWKLLMFGGSYVMPVRKMEECELKYNHFLEMNLTRFSFSDNTITASLFADCNLTGSRFLNCKLDGTEFFRCNLSRADFRKSGGYAVDLSTNQLKGARFSFPEVVNLLNGTGIIID